jgi:hypothetical protein
MLKLPLTRTNRSSRRTQRPLANPHAIRKEASLVTFRLDEPGAVPGKYSISREIECVHPARESMELPQADGDCLPPCHVLSTGLQPPPSLPNPRARVAGYHLCIPVIPFTRAQSRLELRERRPERRSSSWRVSGGPGGCRRRLPEPERSAAVAFCGEDDSRPSRCEGLQRRRNRRRGAGLRSGSEGYGGRGDPHNEDEPRARPLRE